MNRVPRSEAHRRRDDMVMMATPKRITMLRTPERTYPTATCMIGEDLKAGVNPRTKIGRIPGEIPNLVTRHRLAMHPNLSTMTFPISV